MAAASKSKTMKKRHSLLLLVPLGAGLLYIGNPIPEAPDASWRPVPHSYSGAEAPGELTDSSEVDVARIISTEIDHAAMKAAFLETLVVEGSFVDRNAAVRELRKLGTTAAVQALSLALVDDDERIREAALEALAAIGSAEALAAAASVSKSGNAAERARAAETLARTDAQSAADYLEFVIHDDDPRVRAAAVESLGDIGDSRSINIISVALRDPDPEVRERAAEVLDRLDDEALFHALHPPR